MVSLIDQGGNDIDWSGFGERKDRTGSLESLSELEKCSGPFVGEAQSGVMKPKANNVMHAKQFIVVDIMDHLCMYVVCHPCKTSSCIMQFLSADILQSHSKSGRFIELGNFLARMPSELLFSSPKRSRSWVSRRFLISPMPASGFLSFHLQNSQFSAPKWLYRYSTALSKIH